MDSGEVDSVAAASWLLEVSALRYVRTSAAETATFLCKAAKRLVSMDAGGWPSRRTFAG